MAYDPEKPAAAVLNRCIDDTLIDIPVAVRGEETFHAAGDLSSGDAALATQASGTLSIGESLASGGGAEGADLADVCTVTSLSVGSDGGGDPVATA